MRRERIYTLGRDAMVLGTFRHGGPIPPFFRAPYKLLAGGFEPHFPTNQAPRRPFVRAIIAVSCLFGAFFPFLGIREKRRSRCSGANKCRYGI